MDDYWFLYTQIREVPPEPSLEPEGNQKVETSSEPMDSPEVEPSFEPAG